MKAVGWIVAGSVASWLAVAAAVERRTAVEALLGMLAPLAAVCASWVAIERTWRRGPKRLTTVMIGAFGAKLLFFGVYVALMIEVAGVRPRPFGFSFAGYFIALYLVEAVLLQRLMSIS